MNILKISTLVILIILAILTIGLLALQNLASLVAIATGILFLYYLVVFFCILYVIKNPSQKFFKGLTFALFFLPILSLMINPEFLMNFLMSGVSLDMK